MRLINYWNGSLWIVEVKTILDTISGEEPQMDGEEKKKRKLFYIIKRTKNYFNVQAIALI